MSSFIPENEEDFPQVHSLVDEILLEGTNENISKLANEHVPTAIELLEKWIASNQLGFTITDLPYTIEQIDTLIVAVDRFSIRCKTLFDSFIAICALVSKPLSSSLSLIPPSDTCVSVDIL